MRGQTALPTELTVADRPVRLVRELGQGATSRVWLACGADGWRVALKLARSASHRLRLADEAERLALVDSPWVSALVDVGALERELPLPGPDAGSLEPGTPFIALEWLDGQPLDLETTASAADASELALCVCRDLGAALADLHATGFAHGDVKPANVLVQETPSGPRFRLLDLGLSAPADEAEVRGGTRRYLAPEVFGSGHLSDARLRDVWALGLVLAELVSPELRRADKPLDRLGSLALPEPLDSLLRALLAAVPGARPSAEWARRRALLALGEREHEADARARRCRAVERAYKTVRQTELASAVKAGLPDVQVGGAPQGWISKAARLALAIRRLRGQALHGKPRVLGDLDGAGRARWLVALVGPSAAALADRLLALAEQGEFEALTFPELAQGRAFERALAPRDPIEMALELEAGQPDGALLDGVEALVASGTAPRALALALARALKLRAELGRALAVLSSLGDPESLAEAADVARRAGDGAGARALVARALAGGCEAPIRARLSAVLARLEIDAGAPERALALLEGELDTFASLEMRAFAQFRLAQKAAAERTLERAKTLARSHEQRARAESWAGMFALADGQTERALGAFRRATEFAARAGAVLEEATYATGVAASASTLGELGEALSAAERALVLFEHLGRAGDAARASLSIANTRRAAGQLVEAREAAHDALARARAAGDAHCRAYAHLVLADISPERDPEAVEHLKRAQGLIESGADDALRIGARLWARGAEVDLERLDVLAGSPGTALDARLEWWGARALREAEHPDARRAAPVLANLLVLAASRGPLTVQGPAFAAGAVLAARAADGDAVRRLTQAVSEAARDLLRRAPSELKPAVSALAWVRAGDAAQAHGFLPEQLADVENLVRSLGERGRLKPLLRQVVDALVLWTGVERGLLLLKAPGGKLRPRAARNLARADLSGAQLELSTSLAERALERCEPVVAVDASGELPELHQSVHALKLRSVLAVPLIARGEALGVVYLDDRVRRGAFGPRELSWVGLVGTLAALAIADARDQLVLRRAARRAARAEARLARELARREAELDVAERELARTRGARETRFSYDAVVGSSEAVRAMLKIVDRVTTADVPVLILGESGSGKELVARAIHQNGPRARAGFVSENCGAIPEGLLESTLFGHVRGAFTGASRPRTGLFEVAHRGTLFLDEIAEMSLGMQTKLLRALQDGEVRAVGSETVRRVDVRVIGATHRDMEALVASGKFREDLYYRLNVITVRVPALRERHGDIPLLVRHFVERHAGGRRITVSRAALETLSAFSWPGNIRQLENEVRRALVLADDVIRPEHLSPELLERPGSGGGSDLNLRQRVDALEAELVRTALRRTDGNQTRAAEILGLSRFGLQKMIKRLEISPGSRDDVQ
jgi:serine/threonine-protein kinase PknK